MMRISFEVVKLHIQCVTLRDSFKIFLLFKYTNVSFGSVYFLKVHLSPSEPFEPLLIVPFFAKNLHSINLSQNIIMYSVLGGFRGICTQFEGNFLRYCNPSIIMYLSFLIEGQKYLTLVKCRFKYVFISSS